MNLSVWFSIFLTIKISLDNFGYHRNINFDIGTSVVEPKPREEEPKLRIAVFQLQLRPAAPFCLSQT
jgi:hypothetical protein